MTNADTTFVAPYYFNDKLVYITIDELIAALNNRAAVEATALPKGYKAKTGQYPYAANLAASIDALGTMLNNNISVSPNTKGMLPIDVTDSCTCSTFQSCTCSFNPIISVTFTLDTSSDTWASNSLACAKTTTKCTCSGAGSCTSSMGNVFTCDSHGKCDTDKTGANLITYAIPSYADATSIIILNAGCFLVAGGNMICNTSGAFSIGLKEAPWFKANLWQDYFYYEWSPTSNLQSGGKPGISALLVAVGEPIINAPFASKGSAQSRPSSNISDYLDSVENTDGNSIFDAVNKQKKPTITMTKPI